VKPFDDNVVAAYVRRFWRSECLQCPYCGSDATVRSDGSLRGEGPDVQHLQRVTCDNAECGAAWNEVLMTELTVRSIEPLVGPKGDME
jgi:transposase-like protein